MLVMSILEKKNVLAEIHLLGVDMSYTLIIILKIINS